MGLLLAPYNEAMRIGMGFNSYTQTLCIDDVVRRSDGTKASDSSLKARSASEGVPGVVTKKVVDGQADVSQVVSWEAGFVDKVSDLNHSLNISGALSIKVDALNASASASAHYLSETASKDSDIKYSVIVKVTNQKLVADDVTQFSPIGYVPESKFQEVYGDCFISGFLEGGVLNGLISKKVLQTNENMDIGGSLSVAMELKVASVKGEAEGSYKDKKLSDSTETKVTVTWSGGGDIKPDTVTAWDIPSLTKVAMDFPDRVAACPQRTFAILTKYTALRSYHEKTVKGSPMDYEIAGLYTDSLLNSYMEYKGLWADIHTWIKDMSEGKTYVKKRPETAQLVKYRAEPKKDYLERKAKYDKAKEALEKSSQAGSTIILEEPLAANECVPYDANDFGLDQASRDCRFEMIKIVREVNEVTYNPKVATDANRNWRYLSPAIFRLLLPTDKAIMPTPEEIDKMKKDLADEIEANLKLAKEIKEAKEASESTTKSLSTQLEATKTELDSSKQASARSEGSLQQLNKDFSQLATTLNDREKLIIIRLEYGGKSYRTNDTVFAKVFSDILQKKTSIEVNNLYFGGDPSPGLVKYAVISYQWKGHFPVFLEVKETAKVDFTEGEKEDIAVPVHEYVLPKQPS